MALNVNMVLEILGKPADHVKESLNTLVVKLGSEKGVKLLDRKYHDPIPVEKSNDLFTAFAEVSLELESLNNYFGIMFAYMPANIEIVHPEKFPLSNFDLNEIGNKLVQRLHEYDAITKKILFEREIIAKRLFELDPEFFKQAPKEKENPESKTKPKKSKKKSK